MIEHYRHDELRMRWLILLALLINMLILFIFFIMEIDNNFMQLDITKEQTEAPIVFEEMAQTEPEPYEPHMPGEVAALKPRASVFGATEQEAEEAEFMPGTTDSASKFTDGSGPQIADDQINELVTEEKAADHDLDIIEDKVMGAAGLKDIETTEFNQPGSTTFQTEKEAVEESRKRASKQLSLDKEKHASRNNTGRGQKVASPIKKELTMADLATGFIESFKHEGEDWLERPGNENIRPTLKEMKYLSYMQKLVWHLQNVCRLHKFAFDPKRHQTDMQLDLLLTLDRSGKMTNVSIIKSSGNDEFDFFGIQIFKTSYDYPPIPAHIPEDTITTPFYLLLGTEHPRIRFSY